MQNAPSSTRLRWRRVLLAAAFLYLAILGFSRLQQSLLDWDILQSLGMRPGPLYAAISGGVWGVLGLAAAVLAFIRTAWAGPVVFAITLVFATAYWIDFLFLTRAAEMMVNWPFALGLTIVGLLYCAWAIGWSFIPKQQA